MGATVERREGTKSVENKSKKKKIRRIVKPPAQAERERLLGLHAEEQVVLIDPTELKPHPRNEAIYADEPDKDLLSDIQENGIRDPLIVYCAENHRNA